MFFKKNNKPKKVLVSLPIKEDENLYTLWVTRTGKGNQSGDTIIFKKRKVVLEIIASHLFVSTDVDGYKKLTKRKDETLCVKLLEGNIKNLQVDDPYEYRHKET